MVKYVTIAILLIIIAAVSFLHHAKGLSFYRIFTRLFSGMTFAVLVFIVLFVVLKGAMSFRPEMLSFKYTTENVSMGPAIVTTLLTVLLAILFASPIGIFTAIFLVEYTDVENKLVKAIRLATETLAGIPSIVYGLFGMLFFGLKLKLGFSVISGVLTVSIMILPIIMRATEEALKSVHPSVRQGSFALGAGKLRTIFKVVLPIAIPGILSGIILSVGRVVGETAALMYTLGTSTSMPTSLNVSSRTLALHMYVLSSEGKHVGEAYATGMVLLILVLIINWSSTKLANKLSEVE
ncbi:MULTISPECIES: phosphate ABC transporter permease PstA [Peptoniphilus]|jgi:phosphate ABC transporter, permease protein pstA|uniref:phosphate ABC transporter permease PstA n=1 Tax=Peptoniphilus TaxID=162289 RepID=UPI000289ABCF|nr:MULTISPECIES: phosphate ABC transporter permease PstA [Peptoniphilus]MBS6610346.1 phosphate ABC transporter permease PstA [Peptoniphilus harei]MDU1043625.1 phosphate ABC transporter permease PstA [Peptoniphilus rhinitidis]MDU1954546.1 phosphate ABC transporter permease PstA [Peptoniphilus lacydonensis]MDU2109285.1 phosphate ABC transporter permease PstA [Peptoniphilus lacydonensis]MDU2115411.1 phosphate ABC transporter permease PstA [Peptoniphilus lacydonensis]